MASDFIVVFGQDLDPDLGGRLVHALERHGFTTIANEAAGGTSAALEFVTDAAAVVLACGGEARSDQGPSIWPGLDLVVPVTLTPGATVPEGYAQLHAIDLSRRLDTGAGFDDLVRRLEALVTDARHRAASQGAHPTTHGIPLDAGAQAVSWPLQAIDELEGLTHGVHDIGVLLAGDAEHTRLVTATLDEIGASYQVVLEAVEAFVACGAGPDRTDVVALAKIRGGRLAERIHNGRGHCTRIGARYFAAGGLRDALAGRVPPEALRRADATFRQLTTADAGLFDALDAVGSSLTSEARAIYPLVIAGQHQEAHRRFLRAHETLLPLEEALDRALRRFQDVEQSLGYAHDQAPEVPTMADNSVHIYGPVTNSVVANTIKDSQVVLQAAQLPAQLQDDLERLLAAVGAMSGTLSADDAEVAAGDLEQLTDEVASDEPRRGIIRRCLQSLEALGKAAGDVGLPVVELATKIAALF